VSASAIVLQARMGSTRLPGKALADLAGLTVLARCVERLQATSGLPVVLATTTDPADDSLCEAGQRLGVTVVRGAVDDVLGRFVQVATTLGLTDLVRATCDNGCDVVMKMSLAPKTAKRFGFAKRRKTIGRETGSLSNDESQRFFISLKPKAEDALADAERAFKVRLDVRATNDTADTARKKIKITP